MPPSFPDNLSLLLTLGPCCLIFENITLRPNYFFRSSLEEEMEIKIGL
jgi:hypothetical protein